MSTPRIALIGAGRWGRNLARNLDGLGALSAIVDHHVGSLEALKEQYPQVTTTSVLEEVLADVDGVMIATSAVTHYEVAKTALLAGKDVYVEKPITLDQGEGEELIALAAEHQRVLMVGHLLQYHPVFATMRELVSAGDIGAVQYLSATRMGLGSIRTEESSLWCLAPHDLSMILSCVGDQLPQEVVARGTSFTTPGIEDVTLTSLSFADGVAAHIVTNWLSPVKEQRLQIVGTKGVLVFDDRLPWIRNWPCTVMLLLMKAVFPRPCSVIHNMLPCQKVNRYVQRSNISYYACRIVKPHAPTVPKPCVC